MNNWKIAQRIKESKNRGMIIGLLIAMLILAAAVIAIVKINWLKKCFCDCGCMDEFDDDYYLDADGLDDDAFTEV